ncbi:DNA internalization-related competence protein ComEC/Rec2 [Paenibacillus xylaniclasticus]|uniref:DNA internalization-related competence protein ComEC/Rec2 n=1 Tax=Paenibacillus xylaniclasticus TaxID=588083 RepID=UPI000FDA5AF3|nr:MULTISPECIES: DNA internalization-related competence protein ComEC/Rec2 [Paenibacillus]GFN30300.1 ComE operon protein 3 [Paenibacillus curdlanolyticus]
MNRRPIIWIAVSWTAGIAAIGSSRTLFSMLGAGMALIAAAAVLTKRTSLVFALCCLLIYGAGGGWALWNEHRMDTSLPDLKLAADATYPPVTYEANAEGTISSDVKLDGDAVTFELETNTIELTGEASARRVHERLLVRLKLQKESELQTAKRWQRGDHVQLAGILERPSGPSNFGGFDYRRYLNRVQHIHWLLRVKGAEAVSAKRGKPYSVDALLGRVDAARERLGSIVERLYPKEHAGYMKGLVIGNRGDLDPEVYRQFAELGLTHILAISGLHVAVFLYVLNMGLRLLRMTRERALLLLALATPAYVLLSGASPSVIRAGMMAMIGLLAARYNRLKDGLHLLAASAVLMLVWNPAYVYDIGFQLSFLVTAGLIVGVSPVRTVMPRWKRAKPLLDLAAVTVVAQLVSFPITIYYFNQWNPLSIPSNYLFVPFISFIVMPLGAASMAAEPLWPAAGHGMAYAASMLNELTFRLVEMVSSLNGWQMIIKQPPVWWVAAWYTVLAAALRALRGIAEQKRSDSLLVRASLSDNEASTIPLDEGLKLIVSVAKKKRLSILICSTMTAVMLLLVAWLPDVVDRTAVVSVLDVGQGDSILIRTGSGQHILIDGGGAVSFRKQGEEWRERADPFEVGRKVLVPLLKQRGIRSLDLIIATHLDADHIGGLRAVIESIPVKRIWWNGTLDRSKPALELLDAALERDVPLHRAAAGMSWGPDQNTRLDVLWPERTTDDMINEASNQNESSVTILLTVYGRTFLFPGDIGHGTEQRIMSGLKTYCSWSENVMSVDTSSCLDVLKAGHHGSKGSTSEQWLRFWQPRWTIISAGMNNLYGHPHAVTLDRIADAGSGIWRTDRDGEIRFAVKPNGAMLVGWQTDKWG